MITKKTFLIALCLIASPTIGQEKQQTFSQRATQYATNKYVACKKKKDSLIAHVKTNKKFYGALGFSITSLIALIGYAYKQDLLDSCIDYLQNLLPDNTKTLETSSEENRQEEIINKKTTDTNQANLDLKQEVDELIEEIKETSSEENRQEEIINKKTTVTNQANLDLEQEVDELMKEIKEENKGFAQQLTDFFTVEINEETMLEELPCLKKEKN